MADPVSWMMIGSTILSATGSAMGGISENNAAKYTAAQENIAGNNAAGAGQRKAIAERRQGQLVQSRAQAVSAASGGGATDPTVLDIQSGIGAQTDYNAMTALYEGAEAKRGYDAQASIDRYEGGQAQTAGFLKAGTTLLSGGSSLFEKYGKKPSSPGGGNYGGTGYSDLPSYG